MGPCLRIAVVCLLPLPAAGCFFSREPASIVSKNPSSKIPAIRKAVRQQDSATAQHLVGNLQSEDPAIRFYAIRALRDLTGETFGYIWYGDDAARGEAIARWQAWLNDNHAAASDGRGT